MQDLVTRDEPLCLVDSLTTLLTGGTDMHELTRTGIDICQQMFHGVKAPNRRRERAEHGKHRGGRKATGEPDGRDTVSAQVVDEVPDTRQLG